jgi:transcriptional regulator with XRE-family HTH domain
MAGGIGLDYETYAKYESGDLDIPISALYKIANRLGTGTTALITGEDPGWITPPYTGRTKGAG